MKSQQIQESYERNKEINTLYNNIDWDKLAEAILCNEDYGKKVVIFSNGEFEKIENNAIYHGEYVAMVDCSSMGNMDSSFFEEDFVSQDPETGLYIEIETNRIVGTIENVILECIQNGDISNFS